LGRAYHYPLLVPLTGLKRAIESDRPDLVVPCDDQAAIHLQQLYRQSDADMESPDAMRALIVRSLGMPDACAMATARGRLMALAKEEGLRIPFSSVVESSSELVGWLQTHGFPAVLKLDGTWGGQGVEIVRSLDEALAAFERMVSRPRILASVVRLLLDRNPSPVLESLRAAPRVVTVQQFIDGASANRAVACWQGDVLAGISVEAIHTQHASGPATVVRVLDHPEMSSAVARLAKRLRISGLWGADFVLSRSDAGVAYLIEVNPRATPVCHLPLGAGRDLPAALVAALQGSATVIPRPGIGHEIIALFPGEFQRDPASSHLRLDYHDVPLEESELVREGLDRPWSERGMLARARAGLRGRKQAKPAR
jgi:glutathione synthase/RimK-type ligase-like ATP-grasp enzyme